MLRKAINASKADEDILTFLNNVSKDDQCPEFHGFSTKQQRERGMETLPKTKTLYLPLIDMKPSDPDTMMTAMVKVEEYTHMTGQKFTILTCDQQLYRVAVQVK